MEVYYDKLHSFKLMRKKEGLEAAMQAYIDIIMSPDEPLQLRVPETILYGHGTPAPVLVYTGSQGVCLNYNVSAQQLSDFITLCSQNQDLPFRSPVCICIQETTTLVMDRLAVTSLWHKCVASQKKLILQRYILSKGDRQTIAHAKWKGGTISIIILSNNLTHHDTQRSFIKLSSRTSTEERFLTTPSRASVLPMGTNLLQIEEMMEEFAGHLKKRFKTGHYSELEEFVTEFVQDADLNWFAIRMDSYELGRKPKLLKKSKLKKASNSRSNFVSMGNSPMRSIEKPERRKEITALKRKQMFPVSPFELKAAVKMFERSKRIRSSFMIPQLKKSLSKTMTSTSGNKPTGEEVPEEPSTKKVVDMPPIFNFPTPRAGIRHQKSLSSSFLDDDGLGLLNCPIQDRIGLIRDHILRQNNSLYMRIHYQGELPEKRIMREVYKNAVDKVVLEMEHLLSKARLARETINQQKDQEH